MTDPSPPPPRVSAEDVQGLRGDIAGLRQDLYGSGPDDAGIIGLLRTGFRGNRWRIRLIVVSLAMDLFLTALIVVGANGANNACRSANDSRAAQRHLWSYILQINEQQQPPTAQQQATISQFRAYVDQNFAPRHCSFWANL